MEKELEKKKWWLSKTLWINLIAIGAIITQGETGYIVEPQTQIAILGIVNVVMRLITKTGLEK